MARKNKGFLWLSLGAVLLLAALVFYICNIAEDKQAGIEAGELLTQLDSLQNSNPPTDEPIIFIEGDGFCGKLTIEKLSLELPVYNEWSYARLKSAPCRYAGGIDTDDIIIAAHNYKSHFGSLGSLQVKDEVGFVDAYGAKHLYEVIELITLDGTAVSDMQSGGADLTLFTCTKSGEQRVTVRCNRKK